MRLPETLIQPGGSRIVAELDGSGAVATRFVYGAQRHVPDYMIKVATGSVTGSSPTISAAFGSS